MTTPHTEELPQELEKYRSYLENTTEVQQLYDSIIEKLSWVKKDYPTVYDEVKRGIDIYEQWITENAHAVGRAEGVEKAIQFVLSNQQELERKWREYRGSNTWWQFVLNIYNTQHTAKPASDAHTKEE